MTWGVLPGRKQTPLRAELFGFMAAMSVSLDSVIYADCKALFLGRTPTVGTPLSVPDADLWQTAWEIERHPDRHLTVQWIDAHRNIGKLCGCVEDLSQRSHGL